MKEPTEYEILLSDVAAALIDINEVKEILHSLQHDLRTARTPINQPFLAKASRRQATTARQFARSVYCFKIIVSAA